MERIHPSHWFSMLLRRDDYVEVGLLLRTVKEIVRWAGLSRERRPRVGYMSDSWLREHEAKSGKDGTN